MLCRWIVTRTLVITLVAAGAIALPQSVQAQNVRYSGEAAALEINVLGIINTSISDTGPLPSSGGSLSTSLLNFDISQLIDLNLLSASTTGGNNRTDSDASVANVTLTVAGVNVVASVLTSNATAICHQSSASVSGSSNIVALKVNGLSVNVSGAPNQTIPLIIGSLIINEQISSITTSPFATTADIEVNALHLAVDPLADVVISSSRAGVVCPKSIIQII